MTLTEQVTQALTEEVMLHAHSDGMAAHADVWNAAEGKAVLQEVVETHARQAALKAACDRIMAELLPLLSAAEQERERLEQERDEMLSLALHMDMCRECGETSDFRCSDVTDEQRALVKRLAELDRLSGDDK